MVLVPEVVDAVAPTPVLAAGGIASGRQIAAAMALGAEGVWCGSVWLTTEEAETRPWSRRSCWPPPRGHRPLPGADRQAGPHAAHARGPTSGSGPQSRPAAHAAADHAHRRAQIRIDRAAGRRAPGPELATYFVGQVVGR